jgi:hypothetical protein
VPVPGLSSRHHGVRVPTVSAGTEQPSPPVRHRKCTRGAYQFSQNTDGIGLSSSIPIPSGQQLRPWVLTDKIRRYQMDGNTGLGCHVPVTRKETSVSSLPVPQRHELAGWLPPRT